MMAAKGPPLLEREDHPSELFFLHEAPQREWHVAHAVWFWAMGVGSAAFVLRQGCAAGSVGRPFGLDAVDLLGIALVACGGLVLILDLGRPLRLLGALLRPRRSWISRGAVADFVFLLCGTAYAAAGALHLPWGAAPFAAADPLGRSLILLCALCALVIMVYPGFVLRESWSVPLWNSPLVPVLFLGLALASGAGLLVLMVPGVAAPSLLWAGLAADLLAIGALALYLVERGRAEDPAAGLGLRRLLFGRGAPLFWSGALLGLLVPAAITGLALAGAAPRPLILAGGALLLLGGFWLRYAQLLSGVRRTALGWREGR